MVSASVIESSFTSTFIGRCSQLTLALLSCTTPSYHARYSGRKFCFKGHTTGYTQATLRELEEAVSNIVYSDKDMKSVGYDV